MHLNELDRDRDSFPSAASGSGLNKTHQEVHADERDQDLGKWYEDVGKETWKAYGLEDPLSRSLKEATAEAHEMVMRPQIVDRLVTGNLALQIHIRYLMMMYMVYDTLEDSLSKLSSHPQLALVHDPVLLSRATRIDSDIAHLLGGDPSWRTQNEEWSRLQKDMPRELETYLDRLRHLTKPDTQTETGLATPYPEDLVYTPPPASNVLLLAHAYVRYMGDLSGGQTIKRSIQKAYGLHDFVGVTFYEYEVREGNGYRPASARDLQGIKKWFRAGLDNAGLGLGAAGNAAILQEANHAFELNLWLFASFDDKVNLLPSKVPHSLHMHSMDIDMANDQAMSACPFHKGRSAAAKFIYSVAAGHREPEDASKVAGHGGGGHDRARQRMLASLLLVVLVLSLSYRLSGGLLFLPLASLNDGGVRFPTLDSRI